MDAAETQTKQAGPKFNDGICVDKPALISDEDAVLWWVDPVQRILVRAVETHPAGLAPAPAPTQHQHVHYDMRAGSGSIPMTVDPRWGNPSVALPIQKQQFQGIGANGILASDH